MLQLPRRPKLISKEICWQDARIYEYTFPNERSSYALHLSSNKEDAKHCTSR